MQTVRVVVVDDSAVVRRLVAMAVDVHDVEVVGEGSNGEEALELVERLAPDLVLMDVEMPVLDGPAALVELRRRGANVPVVLLTSSTDGDEALVRVGADVAAADTVHKPAGSTSAAEGMATLRRDLLAAVRACVPRSSRARVQGSTPPPQDPRPRRAPAAAGASWPAGSHPAGRRPVAVPVLSQRRPVDLTAGRPGGPRDDPGPTAARPTGAPGRVVSGVVAVGASTGGPEALARLLADLPLAFALPVVVTQHMPSGFTRQLASRLDRSGHLRVVEAADGDALRPGLVLLAPGGAHLELRRVGGEVLTHLSDAAPVQHCRPSVDVMLRSAVDVFGARVVAVVLSGMGVDGRDGCAAVRSAGGSVVVQDAESSVVWGMPGAVAQAGLADAVLPLARLAGAVATACSVEAAR